MTSATQPQGTAIPQTDTPRYSALKAGQCFTARDSRWKKRGDGLGADLLSRDGSVSFINGRRHIIAFPSDEEVAV